MKKGDIVTIKDGSWTRSVVDGELIHEYLAYSTEEDKHYIVVETGCSFPNTGSRGIVGMNIHATFNNTVIQAIDSGKVVFIEERFLRPVPPKHKVMVDMVTYPTCGGHGVVGGQVVEISDKLYKEIQRDSQS